MPLFRVSDWLALISMAIYARNRLVPVLSGSFFQTRNNSCRISAPPIGSRLVRYIYRCSYRYALDRPNLQINRTSASFFVERKILINSPVFLIDPATRSPSFPHSVIIFNFTQD